MHQLKEKMSVVMLSTSKATSLLRNTYKFDVAHGNPFVYGDIPNAIDRGYEYKNLYICSNKEIKEGDWFIASSISSNGQYKLCKAKIVDNNIYDGNKYWGKFECSKIEASTDGKLLGLPLIPESFIRKYVQLQGKIDEVLVEMEEFIPNNEVNLNDGYHKGLKVRKDNTIIITKVEEKLYTREELIDICYKYKKHILDIRKNGRTISESEWFEQNLE